MSDTSNPSSAASAWPPPPSSAPETFTVECVTVTKTSDQLWVNNPKIVTRPMFAWVLEQLIAYGLISLVVITASLDAHTKSGLGWADPEFQSGLKILAYGVVGMFLLGSGTSYLFLKSNYGSGVFAFEQRTRTVKVDRRRADVVNRIKTVTLSRKKTLFSQSYTVNYHTDHAGTPGGDARLGSFCLRRNAERVAQEVSRFLSVTLEDSST